MATGARTSVVKRQPTGVSEGMNERQDPRPPAAVIGASRGTGHELARRSPGPIWAPAPASSKL